MSDRRLNRKYGLVVPPLGGTVVRAAAVLAVMLAAVQHLSGQDVASDRLKAGRQERQLAQIEPLRLGGGTGPAAGGTPLTISAVFAAGESGRPAQMAITADLAPGYHIYSLTQPAGGPIRTKIKLAESESFKLSGEFTSSPAPVTKPEPAFDNLMVESHEGRVTWIAPIELSAGVDPATLTIEGTVTAQICDAQSCMPPKGFPFAAVMGEVSVELGGAARDAAAPTATVLPSHSGKVSVGEYASRMSHATIRGSIEPAIVAPGGKATLTIEAEVSPDYHIYALAEPGKETSASLPTTIGLTYLSGFGAGEVTADSPPIEKRVELPGSDPIDQRYHESKVRWQVPITIPTDAKPGHYPVWGLIGYQTCAEVCDPPTGARFEATIHVGPGEGDLPPVTFSPAKYAEAKEAAATFTAATQSLVGRGGPMPPGDPATVGGDSPALIIEGTESETPVAKALFLAFLAGLILNVMPCVLPVIGLKILSFVEQAGHDRRKTLALNLWFCLGLMTVFMVMAALAATLGVGWGAQLRSDPGKIILASVVFAFSLSFLGVWEIPIPGFVGGSAAGEIARQEGPLGAFSKGVLTTILATPCSGPFLGSALTWAVSQPPVLSFSTFAMIGLGMASPYLLIGAFPSLIRFLPKPGAWMDTFKHLMGFVLLGTFVWILNTVPVPLVIPTVAFVVGLGAACWWIGKTPLWAELRHKLVAWSVGSAIAVATGLFAFLWLGSTSAHELNWQPFTKAALAQMQAENRTVLIDFTAVW